MKINIGRYYIGASVFLYGAVSSCLYPIAMGHLDRNRYWRSFSGNFIKENSNGN